MCSSRFVSEPIGPERQNCLACSEHLACFSESLLESRHGTIGDSQAHYGCRAIDNLHGPQYRLHSEYMIKIQQVCSPTYMLICEPLLKSKHTPSRKVSSQSPHQKVSWCLWSSATRSKDATSSSWLLGTRSY